MAFPLVTVITAAPGLIAAAADIIRIIKERKKDEPKSEVWPGSEKLDEMADLLEKQARVIEELALNNRNLALAVRNNRMLSIVSIVIAVIAIILAI